MIIGPVVEGATEERAVPRLLDKHGLKRRPPLVAEGKNDLLRRARNYAVAQRKKGATIVLFCFDADLDEPAELRVRLRAGCEGIPGCAFIPVVTLENWLLADEGALSHFLGGVSVPPIRNPEAEQDPEGRLNHIFRAAGRASGYRKPWDAARILEAATDRKLRKCPSYVTSLEALAQLTGVSS